MDTTEIIKRIDYVLKGNKRIEWLYIILTTILFLLGISCCVAALITKEFLLAAPSAITTWFLHYPLNAIKEIRQKNIALATAPVLITQLPPDKAAKEIQKLLQTLYVEKKKS